MKKKLLSILTSAAMVVTCLGVGFFGTNEVTNNNSLSMYVSAERGTIGDMKYQLYEDHIEIIDCDASATTVIVPSEVLNLPVTVIADSAFEGCTSLSLVIIPDSVTEIGDYAFYGCTELQGVSIPDTVTSVGASAFRDTYIINNQSGPVYYVSNWAVQSDSAIAVEIKSGTTGIADSAFYSKGLETISIPSSVVTIGDYAFANNSNFKEVNITNGVKTIGNGAFAECTSLLRVAMASTVTTIGAEAFYNCSALNGIKIPDSVTSVGVDAFKYTNDYSKQIGPEIYIDTWVVNCLDSNENLAVNIKSGTRGIADRAFQDKTFVISASIPSGVKIVGANAFRGCTALSQLTLADTLTSIGDYAFAGTKVPTVVVPASVASIGYAAFYNCANMTDITITNSSCAIYDSANTIYSGAKMHVAEKSTAYDYAIKYGRTFDFDNMPYLNNENIVLNVGDNFVLEVMNFSDDIVWISNDTSIATVNSGLVAAISPGETVVYAIIGDSALKCNVTVTASSLKGDANGDGKINVSDIVLIQKCLVNIEVNANLDSLDINSDGRFNVFDVILLRRMILNT